MHALCMHLAFEWMVVACFLPRAASRTHWWTLCSGCPHCVCDACPHTCTHAHMHMPTVSGTAQHQHPLALPRAHGSHTPYSAHTVTANQPSGPMVSAGCAGRRDGYNASAPTPPPLLAHTHSHTYRLAWNTGQNRPSATASSGDSNSAAL